MAEARIGNKLVGDGHPCFISFELGATHTGLESARRLCQAAAEAGADAVKLQTMRSDELMSRDHDFNIEFQTESGTQKESVYRALKRRELTDDEWRELKAYCDEVGILFISTPSGPQTVDLLAEMNVAAIKVSKSDINHRLLIAYIARQGLPVILDAREKFEDVETACQICEKHGVSDIVIMHCPSGYPSAHAGIHLRTIPVIRSIFDLPVAYSDHSVGAAMNFAAIALGADLIEKTITEDRGTQAVEHYMSLELDELKNFVQEVRAVEDALGNPRIIFNSRVKAQHRRSLVAATPIRKGNIIGLESLAFKRPGTKVPADQFQQIVGRCATRDIQAGEYFEYSDVA